MAFGFGQYNDNFGNVNFYHKTDEYISSYKSHIILKSLYLDNFKSFKKSKFEFEKFEKLIRALLKFELVNFVRIKRQFLKSLLLKSDFDIIAWLKSILKASKKLKLPENFFIFTTFEFLIDP